MREWTPGAVHEALLQWGLSAARRTDGGRGYPRRSAFVGMAGRSMECLSTGGVTQAEFNWLEQAIEALDTDQRMAVRYWYIPNAALTGSHTQSAVGLALGISRSTLQDRLNAAKLRICATLNARVI